MPARTYACGACGGAVDELARRCRYCASPVATVRCAGCFQMNVPEAGFCSGCGRQLGLEPIGEQGAAPCPVCKVAMELYRDPSGNLLDCASCGGQFVEHALFREMMHRHDPVLPPPGSRSLPRKPDGRTNYVPCPECAALMNRKNFGTTSGVVVDVCKKHGTWFDEGELPRVLSFVAEGGLDKQRQREAEEAVRLRHEAATLAVTNGAGAGAFSHVTVGSSRVEQVAGLFIELLG